MTEDRLRQFWMTARAKLFAETEILRLRLGAVYWNESCLDYLTKRYLTEWEINRRLNDRESVGCWRKQSSPPSA